LNISAISDSNQKIIRKNLKGWNYFLTVKFLMNPKHYAKFGQYLFFHPDPKVLEKVAIEEIENNGFDVAKISAELGKHPDYVLCLAYQDDSRKDELAEKYQGKNGIQYRYWKSYEDTLKGKYSKQYLEEKNS